MSSLWNRECWIADSLVKLVQSSIDTLGEKYGEMLGFSNDPDSPFWQFVKDLDYSCQELRVKNGLLEPWVLNRDEKWPKEIEAADIPEGK